MPNSPPPPAQQTRDDSSSLSPLATTFHPSASQGASAVASALTGITKRGSSKKSEPSLAGDRSSSASAAHSVKSGDSSHYRTPITTNTTDTISPIPSVVGPSTGLNPNQGFDSDKRVLTALVAQLVAESTQNITQTLTLYFDQRLQAQEFAAQASQAALEKKLLEKMERIEDDQAFFRGEVQAQKKSISELRVSTDKVASEVTKLAEQVKAQHELKVDVSDHVTPEDLDQVWNQLNALQNAVFPESSITFDPIPSLHRAAPQPAGSSHQQAVPPAAPSRERNLPRISEVDHGGHIPFNMGIHAGARRVPLSQLPPGPPSAPPASEYHSPPSHPSEGASHHHSLSRAPPPAHVPAFIPPDSRRAAPVSFASHGPAHSTGYVPSTSTSNIPYDEDQTFKLNGTKNSLDAKSVPTFKPKKGLITYYRYSQTLNNLIATQGPRFDNCHAYLVGIITASFERSQLSACNQFLRTVQNELIELSPLCARPLQSYLQGNTMIATGKDSYSQRILGGVDKLESSPSSAFRTERFHQPYPPGPHQFLQAWALVTHRHLSQPLPDEYRIWSANLKMGVSNSIDVVPPEEGVREFAERVLQVYDLFNMADPLMFAQELERYPTLHVFKAGLPEDYSPHITKILQELGVRTMDRDQQLMHIITKLQNYHEFVISVKHDNPGVTSTSGRNAHISSAGHHTPSPPQAQETGYTRPLRRAFPAAHVSMLDEDVHDVPVHDSEYAYDIGPSNSQIPVDNDDQERVPSLQEELVEVHAHATFPSTMHPRGNPRPPLPPSAGNSYQQRPPSSTGAPGPASTSRPTGAPSVGDRGEDSTAIPIQGKELLQPSQSTVVHPVQQSACPSQPPLSDKVSSFGQKSSDILLPASFTAKQVSDDHWSPFPDANSLACHFANIDFKSIGDYFQIIPQELFYFLNPSDPSKCIGIVFNSFKHISPRTMLDFGSNVFLITDVEARRIGIPILRHKIALNTANGASTILGVTPPLLLSYGSKERELLTRHCMLVIKATPSTCFDLLIGNADCAELRAVHDTGFNTLSLYPVMRDPLMYDDPRVVLPVVSATPSTIL
ncbi:hypothetical protein CEUSTIGMA_g5274.t1 [Chlamydomonas eustigma]|uniref:Uncharacterized protein n=1 Tax=Chlamydomonas eustigma TaxID=1157962 RepID=A0A250X434_9CHLO|nr:hypothetical protein CEUSTIGMA_g5274.t1 [Chlamydomonas eustigma]|eukprot:GAX77831.1 hypothetical protein CEUSTIGMA_g5274.t1 [Chlamydomonas eustigma]